LFAPKTPSRKIKSPFGWEVACRYSELQALYEYVTRQFPKYKLTAFPPKLNFFKAEETIVQERQVALEKILNEIFAQNEVVDCFPVQHFFSIKKNIYGDIAQQGLNQGMLWIKVVEAVGLELEENPAAELSALLKLRVSVPLNHSYTPPTLATETFNKSKHAKWFEEFTVSLPNKEFPVQFKVWNHRSLVSNQLLGRFELDVRPFASNQIHDLWLQISNTARLHVLFRFQESVLPDPFKQINIKLPEFRLVLDRTTFYPGEVVTGTVMFNVGNPLSVNDISLQFQGEEQAHWHEQQHYTARNAQGKVQHHTRDVKHSETFTFFNVQQILFANKPTIESGAYYWPFSFVMPSNLPPTLTHPNAFIRYTCSAHVHRPGLSFNKNVSNEIDVIVNYVSISAEPAVTVKAKKLNFRSADQVVSITGVLDGGHIGHIGNTKMLSFTIDNKSDYDVKNMKVRLVSCVDLQVHSRHRDYSTSHLFAEYNGKEGLQFPVKGGNVLHGQIPLHFPADLLPTVFKQFSPLVEITHNIEIECSMSGFLTGSVSTVLPVILNKSPAPSMIHIQPPQLQMPSAPGVEPVLSFQFDPHGVTPMPPMDSPALFEQQYGVNFHSLNQLPGSTPQD
jgi:hypothetical protein